MGGGECDYVRTIRKYSDHQKIASGLHKDLWVRLASLNAFLLVVARTLRKALFIYVGLVTSSHLYQVKPQ